MALSPALWQPMSEDDVASVDDIANFIHVDLPERTEVFCEKLRLFPYGARKLVIGGETKGYAIAHPWRLGNIPALDTFLEKIPANADCLYAHDIAIRPEARGNKASADYIAYLKMLARQIGVGHLACVSVYGTYVWWEKLGFRIANDDGLTEKLSGYGHDAKYMVADVYETNWF